MPPSGHVRVRAFHTRTGPAWAAYSFATGRVVLLVHMSVNAVRSYDTSLDRRSRLSVRACSEFSTLSVTRERVLAHLPSPRTTPFTYVMVGLLLLTSLLLRTHPNDIDGVVGWASTNIQNLTDHPMAATVASAFVVPSGLFPDLLIVAVAFAVVERAIGTARVLLVALSGHVLATALTEGAVAIGISIGTLPTSDAVRSDVGISYAMYAVLAASILLLNGPPRIVAAIVLVVAVSIPVLTSMDMTAFGHLSSVAIGFTLMSLLPHTEGSSRASTTSSGRIGGQGPTGNLPRHWSGPIVDSTTPIDKPTSGPCRPGSTRRITINSARRTSARSRWSAA
jgi:hypothetical protein